MSSKVRTSLLSLTVIAVLIFSAIGPTIVYADDDTPPDTTTTDTIVDESHSGDNDSSECHPDQEDGKNKKNKKHKSRDKDSTSCSSDGTAEDAGGAGNESGNTDPAAPDTAEGASAPEPDKDTPPADTNLLSAVPENTSVTVLNADGQPEPLATHDAAAAIASTTDPIWCPQGQPPVPGANGCTTSFTSFNDLLTFLSGNAAFQGAGTIYVEQGAYAGGESSIDFNSYNLSNISSSDLTVQGGWDTTANPVDPATASTSNFSVPILIGSSTNPWGGSLTINNLVITNAIQNGLTLYSQNNINVSNVEITNTVTGAGAELDAGRDVTITNSKFLRNNTAGSIIRAGGNVAIANSEFSNTFNQRRQVKGLDITSGGSVSLFNVLVVGNRRVGANINALGRVTIGSSVFSETNALNGGVFYGYGLQVVTPDAIDLAGVTANNNFLWGASLDAGGDVAILDSIFNANSTSSPTFIDDTGLIITSDGNVALNNVTANDNRLIGAAIDAAGTVSINNSTFSNNQGVTVDAGGTTTIHGLGLMVVSLNSIFVNNVTASNNSLFGAHLEAGGEVAVNNSVFSSNGSGLEMISAGNASLANTILDGNQTFGASIQAGPHVFLDLLTATNNGTDGVQVTAACTHLNGGTYSGNNQYGLNLTTSALDLAVMPTFGGNTGGDIFPATPTTCPPPVVIITPANPGSAVSTNSPQGSSSNGNTSSLQQAVSFIPNTGNGASGTSLLGASLNSLFFGITREVIPGGVVTSIFAGQYIYVYSVFEGDSSIDNLQIIINPNWQTGVAMVGA